MEKIDKCVYHLENIQRYFFFFRMGSRKNYFLNDFIFWLQNKHLKRNWTVFFLNYYCYNLLCLIQKYLQNSI